MSDEQAEETIHRLVYASAETVAFSESDLLALLEVARANNARLGVSGMLLYHGGSFLQVLEGDEEVVESLYDRIEQDERHDETVVLLKEEGERHFAAWTMGFVSATQEMVDEIEGLNAYLRTGRLAESDEMEPAERVRKILGQFRDGRWHREIR